MAAACGLANTLLPDVEVTIASAKPFPKEISQLFDVTPFDIIQALPPREVILSLNRRAGTVEDVRWRESEEKVQFIITPGEGAFEFNDVDIAVRGRDYDLVITIGCRSLDMIGSLYSDNKSFFKDIKILNIDIDSLNEGYGEINEIGQNSSLSGLVLDLVERYSLGLKKDGSDMLFKGIFWSNEGFRQNEDLTKAVKTFIAHEGELVQTVSQIFDSLTIAELRYIGGIISNLKVSTDGVISSKMPHNQIQGVDLNMVLYPELNIISRVKDFKVAILLSETEPGTVVVRAYAKNTDFDVFQLFSRYTPMGNSRRVTFTMREGLDEAERQLLAILSPNSDAPASDQTSSAIPTIDEDKPAVEVVSAESEGNKESALGDETEKDQADKDEGNKGSEIGDDSGDKAKVEESTKDPLTKAAELPKADDVEEQVSSGPMPLAGSQLYTPPAGPLTPQF